MQAKGLTDKSKLTKFELAFLIIAATVTITLVSACSPLFPFNPWDDANCFFTIGRGIIHGLVPYRDLYDHKGPLLYFLYALAACISEKSFTGAWILECIAASIYAVFSWKTVKLFTDTPKFSIMLMPFFLGLTYTFGMFNFGGNAEELCFPLLTVCFFFALRSIVINNDLPTNTDAFISGLIASALFWIKYTLLGFMAGFILFIVIKGIAGKKYSILWSLIWRFLSGFVILSLPIFIYFLANNSLEHLWKEYFYNNFTMYLNNTNLPRLAQIPVIKNFYFVIVFLKNTCLGNPSFGALLLLSVISLFLIDKKYRIRAILLFLVTFSLSAGFVFTKPGAVYYYGYILAYCLCMALIPIVLLIKKAVRAFKDYRSMFTYSLSILFVILYALTIVLCKNMYLIFQPKEFLSQYRIANTINQTENAKILTYDVMDSGFFTAAGVLPANKFYCFHNNETAYTAVSEEKERLIKEGYFDYIVTYYFCECNWENYKFIGEETGIYVGNDGKKITEGYKLYKRV